MSFLNDEQGNQSAMRLMCLISLFGAMGFGWLTIKTGSDNGLIITLAMLCGAFAPKAVQKIIEKKIGCADG